MSNNRKEKEKKKTKLKEQQLFRVSRRSDSRKMQHRATGWVCLHTLGYLGDENSVPCATEQVLHLVKHLFYQFLIVCKPWRAGTLSVFTRKVSAGPNSNTETRIKSSSASFKQQELPHLQNFFLTLCCVSPYRGFRTFYLGRLG